MRQSGIGRFASRAAKNLLWGVANGLAYAFVFVAYVAVLRVLRGPRAFAYYGVTFPVVVAAYIVGGLGGGIILGFIRPLTRWRAGGILAGIFVATFAYGAIWVAGSGWITQWDTGTWIGLVLVGLGAGTYAGNKYWEENVYPKLPPPLSDSEQPAPRRPLGLWRP